MKNQILKSPKLSKNLTLTGMMGVGKSTVGKNLAKRLNFNFIDVDKMIEFKEGASINLIFKNKSEKYFRKLESEITLQALKKNNSVISLGGGAFLNRSIRDSAKKNSVSFWLDVEIGKLVNRLKRSKTRPLLYKKDTGDTIRRIFLERKKVYNQANFRIRCKNLKSKEIVEKIIKLYEKSGN